MVIEGKAGMQIMGDWAKGEFLKAGKKPGTDFVCIRFPGTQGAVTFNSDQFMMFKVGDDQKNGAAHDGLGHREPGLPVGLQCGEGLGCRRAPTFRTTPSTIAARRRMKDLAEANKKRHAFGSMAHGHAAPAAVKNALYDVVTRHFNGEIDSDAAAKELADAVAAPSKLIADVSRESRGIAAGAPASTSPRGAGMRHGRDDSQPSRSRLANVAAACGAGCRRSCWRRASRCILLFVYGFILFTGVLSFTDSKLLPIFRPGSASATTSRLFSHPNWIDGAQQPRDLRHRSTSSSAACSGLGLAILLDQKIRGEGVLRPIYLYPMALSFIVTGIAWKWFLDPGIGLEHVMQRWGWESFSFRWIKEGKCAIYTIVIAAVWQSSGFVMAMFLAGLRGVDNEIIKAAQIDGASTFTIYRRIIIPLMRPVFLSAFVVLAHLAIKSYDLVVAHDRRRTRHGDLDAGDLHAEIHLQPQRDGHGRRHRPSSC